MKTPEEIMNIIQSIKNVRLDKDGELEILFDPPSTTDGWERATGYNFGSFTHQLLALIEESLTKDQDQLYYLPDEVDIIRIDNLVNKSWVPVFTKKGHADSNLLSIENKGYKVYYKIDQYKVER